MTKSAKHGRTCSSLFHLLKDVRVGISACDHVRLLKSYEQICRRVSTRGHAIILRDLPSLGKLLDKSLSSGFFDSKQVPSGLAISGGDFVFSELIYRLFRRDGSLIEPADPGEVFFIRCVLYHYKKVEVDPSYEAIDRAEAEFVANDRNISLGASLDWDSDDCLPSDQISTRSIHLSFGDVDKFGWDLSFEDRSRLSFIDYVTKLIVPQSVHIDWADFKPKHGPGAVSDLPSGSDKYVFPSWPRKLSLVFPSNGWASHVHDCHEDSLPDSWGDEWERPASKVLCVRKTYEKPRVIASEPTAHMYCQQAIMNYLRENMSSALRSMIEFRDQTPSQMAALAASKDGAMATIDLSSASDRLSTWAVERLFSRNLPLLDALVATSTRRFSVTVRGKDKRQVHTMRKFAPMGSAVTFPVQSIFYAVVALAASAWRPNWERSTPSYFELMKIASGIRVFGDDIIVSSSKAEDVCSLLSLCGMVVNTEKTHIRGLFRESCGMDAYAGVDVTPLYMSSFLLERRRGTEVVSWIEVSNNAYRKGLWHLSSWMVSQIPTEFRRYLPISSRPLPCASLFTYIKSSESLPLSRRWNDAYQQTEYQTIVTQTRLKVEGRNAWPDLLQYFIEGCSSERTELAQALTRVGHRAGYRTRVVVRWVILK